MFKDKLMVSKENKKLILGILLTFIVCMGSAIFAVYMTNPQDSNLKYPNPGHYPGEIGPGTFNASDSTDPYWSFPADKLGSIAFLIEGTGFFYEGLRIVGNPFPGPDFLVEGDTQLGNDSSDKTTVKGDLNVSGDICLDYCRSTWPSGGGAAESEVFDLGVNCTTECYDSSHSNLIYVKGSGCAGIGLDCSEECYDSIHTNSGCTAGSGCSGPGTDCSLQCYNSTHEKVCTSGSGCSGSVACPSGQVCEDGTGCRHYCICDGTGYETQTLSGDTVYVDCNADKCWTPTADSEYQWGTGTSGEDCTPSSCIGGGSVCPACNYCDALSYGGFSDWVLPDKTTLEDLCNSGSCSGTCFGGDGSTSYYWSSTEHFSNDAYEVYFNYCNLFDTYKDGSIYVRCVRG